MRVSLNTVSTLALATFVSFVSAAATPYSALTGYTNAAYYVNWAIYARSYEAKQVPATELTRLLYAFATVSTDGTVSLTDTWSDIERRQPTDSLNETGTNVYGNIKQLYLLKKKNRQLKTQLSIGGFTLSVNFPAAASTPETRARFARTSVQLVQDLGFDGLDVDWEYPSDLTQGANYVLLLAEIRAALDRYAAVSAPGYHFLLTAAVAAGPQNYKNLDLRGMSAHLDNFYFMGFDYAGSWLTTSGHASNIYPDPKHPTRTPASTDKGVRDYIAAGVPAHKIVLGTPIYGRAFQNTSGIGELYNGVGPGHWEAGVNDYKDLPRAGAKEYFDAVAMASYSYDKTTKELITYDNPRSIRAKSKYIREKGLGGAMFWETSGDKPSGADSLISTVARSLKALDHSKNLLSYPASAYDNLKAGVP